MTTIALSAIDHLDRLGPLDWDGDYFSVALETQEAVTRLAEDTKSLRELVYGVETNPVLLGKCEHHALLDKIVIYDALDRGFRIRMHLSTDNHFDRPHDHRFSFTSRIVTGSYQHIWHAVTKPFDETVPWTVQDLRGAIDGGGEVEPRFITNESAPACYTIHHSLIHTTVTTDDTVSIFLRGPAEKDRSLIMDRESRRLWWRYGEHEETAERRKEKRLTVEQYRVLRTKLERLGIV